MKKNNYEKLTSRIPQTSHSPKSGNTEHAGYSWVIPMLYKMSTQIL